MDGPTFHDLYDRHARDVFRLARYLVGDADAASEITAETFFRAWVGREAIRVGTVKAYLLSIARNLAVDEHRRRRRYAAETATEPRVEERAAAGVELRETLDALRQLRPEYREPLALVASGASYQEAARILGLPVATLKIRVYRARLQLARVLTGPAACGGGARGLEEGVAPRRAPRSRGSV